MKAQRWTGLVEANENGGFVAVGDYLALTAERDAFRAEVERLKNSGLCMVEKRIDLEAERDALAAKVVVLRRALEKLSREQYHIERPPTQSLEEIMRNMAWAALEATK